MENQTVVKKKTSWFWHLTYAIGPDIIILVVFLTLQVVLHLIYGGQYTFVQSSIILPLVFMVLLIVVAFTSRIRKIFSGDVAERKEFFRLSLGMVRDWLPLIFIVFIYENFHDLTDLIRPDVVDGTLRRIDEP